MENDDKRCLFPGEESCVPAYFVDDQPHEVPAADDDGHDADRQRGRKQMLGGRISCEE